MIKPKWPDYLDDCEQCKAVTFSLTKMDTSGYCLTCAIDRCQKERGVLRSTAQKIVLGMLDRRYRDRNKHLERLDKLMERKGIKVNDPKLLQKVKKLYESALRP